MPRFLRFLVQGTRLLYSSHWLSRLLCILYSRYRDDRLQNTVLVMGRVTVLDQSFRPVSQDQIPPNLLARVTQAEKKTFPKDEVMDFDMELKKHNTQMDVVIDVGSIGSDERPLAAYMLYARLHGIALLHKISVLECYQRQGIARGLLSRLQESLQHQGCERLQLWVDATRTPARALYQSAGFRETERARDYYAPGRTGIKMIIDLNAVW